VSPDGSKLSYVRRIRAVTVMNVMDLVSGTTRQAVTGLQRDNQEGFAFHGVFPGYAWMPDGASIVATADGKIWKFDVASGKRTEIPYTAKIDQTSPIRSTRRGAWARATFAHGSSVGRWRSADGKTLVFSPSGTSTRWTCRRARQAPDLDHRSRILALVLARRTHAGVRDLERPRGGNVWTMPYPADHRAR
jgi:Tol biopolymer transport system component